MRFSFNKKVRDSLAEEMKKVSVIGGIGFAFLLGEEMLKAERSWALVVIVAWFLLLQALAHVLLAFEDDNDNGAGE